MIAPFWAIGLPKEKFTMVDRKLKMLKTDVHFHLDLRVLPAVYVEFWTDDFTKSRLILILFLKDYA
jgi:hypothetical protein